MQTDTPLATILGSLHELGLFEGLSRLHKTVLAVDEDERIVWMSGELSALVSRDMIGESARELFGTRARHPELRDRMDAQGFLANEPTTLVCADGREIAVELSALPIRAAGPGTSTVKLAVVRSVEGTEAEDTRVSSDYLRAVLDSSPEAVLVVDRSGFVTYANPALERLLGRSASELVGVPVTLALPASLERIADALRPDAVGTRELEVETPDGIRTVSVVTSPLLLARGEPAGTVAFLRDVTAQRLSEEELARKNQELEHYVHAVSHDLRTPLVSLLGFSRLLMQDYGELLDDTGRHFLERIEQASRTMEALTNDLLELSRIGRGDGSRDLVDPLPVLKQVAAELKPRLEEGSIALQLPETPPLLLCVRTQLYQIFSNLIGNAVDHMGSGDGRRIEVEIDEGVDAHILCVRDNGAGIPPEDRERVFEIFQTLGPTSSGQGTGIGLAIVRKIAESHGGRVWLESAPGSGAAFFVSLARI